MVTLELNHNRQQDADGGTINRVFTMGKKPNVNKGRSRAREIRAKHQRSI